MRETISIRSIKKISSLNSEKEKMDGEDDNSVLKSGDSGVVELHFIHKPCFVQPGSLLLFRERQTKATGKVLEVLTDRKFTQRTHKNLKSKYMKK